MNTSALDETRRAYGIEEIATMYRLSRQKIYDEINAGRLKSMKVGKRRMCTLAHLEDWEKEVAA